MRMRSEEFVRQIHSPEHRTINIFFEGMSGVGKSYWAHKFGKGFSWPVVDIDDHISEHPSMKVNLKSESGTGVQKLGQWLGLPGQVGYEDRENKYLEIEGKIMRSILDMRGHIIALSGSCVSHSEEMDVLKQESGLFVYLKSLDLF